MQLFVARYLAQLVVARTPFPIFAFATRRSQIGPFGMASHVPPQLGTMVGLLGPIDPPPGVDFDNWDYALKQQLEAETGVSVAYRFRKQWGSKKVTCSGPTFMLEYGWRRAIEILGGPPARPAPAPPPLIEP